MALMGLNANNVIGTNAVLLFHLISKFLTFRKTHSYTYRNATFWRAQRKLFGYFYTIEQFVGKQCHRKMFQCEHKYFNFI